MKRNVVIGCRRNTTRSVHPYIYRAVAGLALVFVLAAWAGAVGSRSDFLIAMATVLIAVAATIWWVSVRVWRANHREEDADPTAVRRWIRPQPLETWSGPVKGGEAAI